MLRKNRELKLIFLVLAVLFAAFLAVPAVRLLLKSFLGDDGFTGTFYISVFTARNFIKTLGNSFLVSIVSALLAVGVAFVFAYAIHYTKLPRGIKRGLQAVATLPMFLPLTFDVKTLTEVPDYTAPITSQEGAIIINTEVLKENNLPTPTCLKDLADPVYKDFLAITDVQSSSTAWLLMQALISAYGEDGAQSVLHDLYANAGDHVESSGSAPLKLCEAGEVAVGFGLRHQAVAAKAEGLPIDFVDPTEGNFSLTESVAVLDKGDKTNPLAMKMAQCIIENGRSELQQNYPNPLYEGESADSANKSAYPKTFDEPLTFELYEKHVAISEAAKG